MNGLKSMSDIENSNISQSSFEVRRAMMDSITIYEITEDEFEELQKPSDASFNLTFFVAFLSFFVSFLITILTTEIKSIKIYNFFVIVIVVSFCASIFFGIQTIRDYKTLKNKRRKLVQKIQNRLKLPSLPDKAPNSEDSVEKA